VIGRRRSREEHAVYPRLPLTLILDLMRAAVSAGVELRGALDGVGRAIGGPDGYALVVVSGRIADGLTWKAAWDGTPGRLQPLADALEPSWSSGCAPGETLAATAEAITHRTAIAGDRAVGELPVRLVLPLTLCLLPAFFLVGLVPLVMAVALSAGMSDLTHP